MPGYRGARGLMEGGAEVAGRQKSADSIANKAQRVRKAAETARKAKERADAHENELSTGVLRALDLGEMALLNRLNGELPNRNISTIQDATKIGDGVVAARALISQDSAAFNLWAQNAMIRNAKVESLAVDKLTAGTFTAGQIILAGGGALKAGQVLLSATGIRVPQLPVFDYLKSSSEYKITSTNEAAGVFFVTSSSANAAVLEGDSDSSRHGIGYIAGIHNRNDYDAAGNATVRALSYSPSGGNQSQVNIKAATIYGYAYSWVELHGQNYVYLRTPELSTDGSFYADGGLEPNYTGQFTVAAANGGWVQWFHGLGSQPSFYEVEFRLDDGTRRPIANIGTQIYVEYISSTIIRVTNNTANTHAITCKIYK